MYKTAHLFALLPLLLSISVAEARADTQGIYTQECNITAGANPNNGPPCSTSGAVSAPSFVGIRSDPSAVPGVGLAAAPIDSQAADVGQNICVYVDNPSHTGSSTGGSVFAPFLVPSDYMNFYNNAGHSVIPVTLSPCTRPFGVATYTVPAPPYSSCSVVGNTNIIDTPNTYQRYPGTYVSATVPKFLCNNSTTVEEIPNWLSYNTTYLYPLTTPSWKYNPAIGPDLTLSASPTTVASGSTTTLTWSIVDPYDASTCVGTSTDLTPGNWNNTPISPIGGQQTFTPAYGYSPITYTVTCKDKGTNTATSVATTTVTVQTPLSVAITSDTKSVTSGNPAHLTWVVTNSTAPLNCVPSSSDGSWPPSPPITVTSGGPIAITPTAPAGSNATYSLSCTDAIQNTPVKSNVINVAVTAADCLAENGLTWGQGSPSGSCTGNLGAGTLGSSPEIINTAANFTGTEIATCNAGGVWSFSGQTCNASGGVGGGSTCAAATTGFEGSCGYTIGQGDACNFGGYVGSSAYQDIMNADNAVGINSSTDGTLAAVLPYIWGGIACSLPDDNDKVICNDFKHNPNGASFIDPEMANDGTPVGTSGTVAGSITDGNGTVLSTYGIVNWSWSIRFCTTDEHGHENCGPITAKISRVCPDCTPPVPLKYDSCYNTYNGEACKKSEDGLMCDYFTSYCDKAGVLEQLSITYWPTADGDPPCGAFKGFGQ